MIKDRFTAYIQKLQDSICNSIETIDGKAKFREDEWTREAGGGGKTRVISKGNIFEKGGVNTSVVHGDLHPAIKNQLKVDGNTFFACGLSLVIHPNSPHVPTIHMNVRYFEIYDDNKNRLDGWFGGGIDLTPYYLDVDDAKFFHSTLKSACDKHGADLYPDFKKKCDSYFYNSHRNETRGIGGIFYDYLKANEEKSIEDWLAFSEEIGNSFNTIYETICNKHKHKDFSESEKFWQEIRRGRYVEFNLLHDRGTHFGIKSNGRTESILMSLPATVRWEYDYHPEPNSREENLINHLKAIDWLNY